GVLERIGRAVGLALVEPQPPALGIRTAGFLEARLVDETEVLPPVLTGPVGEPRRIAGATVRLRGMRRQDFQEIDRAAPRAVEHVPEAIVAGRPHQPRVAALDLFLAQRDRTVPVLIHAFEIVLVRGLERRRLAAWNRRERLVEDVARSDVAD